jgi:hypothetical protein
MTTAPRPDLAPSETYALLGCLLAAIEVTQTADFIVIPVFEHDVTARAELVVGRDAGSADVEKAHMYPSDIKECQSPSPGCPVTTNQAVCRGGSICGPPKNACAPYRAIKRSSLSNWLRIVARESSWRRIVIVS